jgi:hypothetical protein
MRGVDVRRGLIGAGLVALAISLVVLGWGLTGSQARGEVLRARDGRPIGGAVLVVDGQRIDASGGAIDTKLKLGRHKVVFTASGYETLARQIDVSIFRQVDLGKIRLRNADLRVTVVENYPGFPVLSGATVTAGGRTSRSQKGVVNTLDLPVGSMTVAATAPDCTEATATIRLRPGTNSVTCTLTPSLLSVVRRAAQNVIDRDLVLSYQTQHPARQKQWGAQEQYVAALEKSEKKNQGMVNVLGFKVLTPVRMGAYRDKPSGQTFNDVYRVPISFRISSPILTMLGQKEMSMKQTNYWILYQGRWRDIGDGDKVDKK